MSNKCFYFQTYDPTSLFSVIVTLSVHIMSLTESCYEFSPVLPMPVPDNRDGISWWRLQESREELRERERAWLENEMRRETMVQDWRKGKHWTRGEVRLFNWLDSFLTFVYFNYRNQMSLLEPSQLDSNLVDPVNSQRPKIFLKTGLTSAEMKTSEAGKSPLKAAIGPEEWSKFTNFKTDKKKDSSTLVTKASLDLSDLTVKVSLWSGGTLVSVRGWWPHHPTTRPHDPRDCPGVGYCLLQ